MTITSPSPSTVDTQTAPPPVVTDGHCAYQRLVFVTVEHISESMPFDRAIVHAAAYSIDLLGHALDIDQILSLYRYGRHLANKDNTVPYTHI